MRKATRFYLVISALLLLTLCLLCVGMTACDDSSDIPEVTTDGATAPETPTGKDTDMTELVTEATTEAELFAPDPTRAVPKYDTLMSDLDTFPLYFKYGGVEFNGFKDFTLTAENYENIDRGVKSTLSLRHPEIPAAFALVATVYPEESAYEYVVYITNDGDQNTEVISDLCFNIQFDGADACISGIKGDAGNQNYTPYEHDLTGRTRYNDRSTSGRPSHGTFPYYNLSYGNGGTFIAIGWPGTWYANFTYSKSEKVTTLKAGQGNVSTYIAPGETLRTPLMGFVEYEGLSKDEQTNAWRHYYINDVMRKIDGELTPIYTGVSSGCSGSTTNKLLLMLSAHHQNGVTPELVWLDAGWYTGAAGEAVGWPQTGSQDMDLNRFPDAMSKIGQYTSSRGMRMMIWFEAESIRLDKDAFLAGQAGFKETWFLPKTMEGTWLEGYIMNLTDPECVEWVFNKICKVIDESGATAFRSDFNCDPAPSWTAADGKDRQGMTENLYVQGYLSLWDKIIERYPGIYMDSCASGGGRNDLETLKRAVPLHYTDWFDGNHEDYDMKGKMTQALFAWFPYFKNEIYQTTNMYKVRMNYAPLSLMNLNGLLQKDTDWTYTKQGYAEFEQIRDYFYADYYQLFEWQSEADRWNGWEFYDPATASGYASVFCHQATTNTTATVKLKGLDPEKQYRITDFDGLVDVIASGKALMETGISVTVPEKPYAVILLINPAT